MTAAKRSARNYAVPVMCILAVIALVGWTFSNQLQINAANAKLSDQARAGQIGLNRTCRLIPISKKIYTDALRRGVISVSDYRTIFATADRACAAATSVGR